MPRTIDNRSIIVTGASSGIGAATAIACADAGMHVVLNARRADRLRDLAARIESLDRRATVIAGDVTEPDISQRMLDAASDLPGGLYAVFANAGYGTDRPTHEMTMDEVRAMFEVNFFAAFDLVQRAARTLMERSASGHLLMCSSCLAKFTMPGTGVYSASKAAQNHVCRAMRAELRAHNVDVTSVHPVGTRTEFFEVSAERAGKRGRGATVADRTPRMFMQSPERVAFAVVRCLRRPKPEVWTSTLVRLMAGVMTMSPRLGDFAMRRAGRAAE